MRCVVLLAALVVAAAQPLHKEFEDFLKKYGKKYDGAEKNARFMAFKTNYYFILAENAKNHSYTLGINGFMDMTSDEFAMTHLGMKAPKKQWGDLPYLGRYTYSGATLPTSVDWTTKGAVTPVKDQGQCGSCWAFSTTGSLEGAWEIATGNLVSLSEQQFVDCASSFGNQGCNGGLMDYAFQYAEQNAICTEESYPYEAVNGICKASSCKAGIPAGDVTGYHDVATDDEQALMEAVAKGPVSIAIEADKSVFQLYESGVLSSNCGSQLDHGVLAVGYGTLGGQKYWLVKNSWGASWGDKGYVKLLRDKAGAGECGLKSAPSFPVMSTKVVEEIQVSGLAVHPDRVEMIKTIESTPGVMWKAEAHSRFASLPPGASKSLCGVKGNPREDVDAAVARGQIERLLFDANVEIPVSFDSAENWPQCAKIIGDIRDQSNCGCCWAFGGAEAASDRMCIATNAALMLPLSAQDVCFNSNYDGCDGGYISTPWDYIKQSGVVTGGQYNRSDPLGTGLCSSFSLPHCHHHGPQGSDPYPDEGQPGCPSESSPTGPTQCDADALAPHNNFASDKYSYTGSTITANGEAGIQQAIMAGGPMEVAFSVYSDFENYASGIYHHVSGSQVGGHAVKAVGWGVENGVKYWKIANSWNPYWGEKGYFRIRRGTNEGGIEDQAVASSPTAKWSRAGSTAKDSLFKDFEVKFNKQYASLDERARRLAIFTANLIEIEHARLADSSAQYSHLTPFADWTVEEFAARNTLRSQLYNVADITQAGLRDVSDLPDSFDWRDKGAVNPVKNQGQCGSCWAFSTVANIEGVNFLKTKQLLSLSEQELVDCDTKTGDQGCQGGLPSNAYKDMIANKIGLEFESDYPYAGKNQQCEAAQAKEKVFISNWTTISTDEDQIAAALMQYGPLSIGINAGPMQWYSGGVANPLKILCNPSKLDHGVAIVGFGTDSGTKYWTIRNSWGETWGEKGYYRIIRGTGACGLNTMVTTALIGDAAAPQDTLII